MNRGAGICRMWLFFVLVWILIALFPAITWASLSNEAGSTNSGFTIQETELTFHGDSSRVIEDLILPARDLIVVGEHSGPGAFVVILLDDSSRALTIFDEMGGFSGSVETSIDSASNYRLAVTADGPWSITFTTKNRLSPVEYEATISSLEAEVSELEAVATANAQNSQTGLIDPTQVEISIDIPATGLINGSSSAIAETTDTLEVALAPYNECRAGLVLLGGWSSNLNQGLAISEAVNEILVDEFPEIFGEAALQNFATLQEPVGRVDLNIFFYRGCDALAGNEVVVD